MRDAVTDMVTTVVSHLEQEGKPEELENDETQRNQLNQRVVDDILSKHKAVDSMETVDVFDEIAQVT